MTWVRARTRMGLPLACIALMLVLLVAGCAGGLQAAPATKLAGTMLNGKQTPDFALVDASGAKVSISALRGKPVALTFLYTSCPDTCPIVTAKFAELGQRLGERAGQVSFVAVTVDPERDTAERVNQFLADRGLANAMMFLTGERAALESVWKAYYVGVNRLPIKAGDPESRRYGAYAIAHTDAVYVIDKEGRQRAFLRSTFEIQELLDNLEILLSE